MKTAEQFYNEYWKKGYSIKQIMKEFAKMHVKEALEEASEKARAYYDEDDDTNNNIEKSSILNAYHETNII